MAKLKKLLEHWWGMLLAIALIVLVWYAPLVMGWQVASNFPGMEQQVNYFYYYAIRAGDSILWNPYSFSGFPSFVDNINISPVQYLGAWFLNPTQLYYIAAFIFTVLAGFFTALLLRSMQIGIEGQLMGAIIYIFAFSFNSLMDLSVIQSFLFGPLFLWLILLLANHQNSWKKQWALCFVGIVAVAIGWFGSHAHFFINNILVGFLFAGYLFLRDRRVTTWSHAIGPFIYFGLMVMGGTAIALLKFVPMYVMLSDATRTLQSLALSNEGFTFSNLLYLISPSFDHPLLHSGEEHIYVGFLALVFATGIFTIRRRSYAGFFSYLALFAIAMGFRNSPLYAALQHIPPFNYTHSSDRWIYGIGLSIAVLAGMGINALLREPDHESRWRVHVWWFGVIGLLLTTVSAMGAVIVWVLNRVHQKVIVLMLAYFDKFVYRASSALSLDYYHAYATKLLNKGLWMFDLKNPWFLWPTLFLFVSSILCLMFYWRRITVRQFVLCAIVCILGNVWLVRLFPFDRASATPLQNDPPSVSYIKNHPHFRTWAYLQGGPESAALENYFNDDPPTGEWIDASSAFIIPSSNIQYQLQSAGYFGIILNVSMARLVDYIGGAVYHWPESLNQPNLSPSDQARLFAERKPIIDLLGISHITSSYPLDEKIFTKVFTASATSAKLPLFIYENKNYRPLFYFTNESWLLDLSPEITPNQLKNLLTRNDQHISSDGILINTKRNATAIITTHTTNDSLLVFSQNNILGWTAFIDGAEVPIRSFATTYQSINIPSGTHEINFEYQYKKIWQEFFIRVLSKR